MPCIEQLLGLNSIMMVIGYFVPQEKNLKI